MITKAEFEKWWADRIFGIDPSIAPHSAHILREAVWNYFAPHLRGSFPREAAENIGNYYFGVMSFYISKPADEVARKTLQELFVENFVKCFEKLWNDPIPDEKICETCGGSRKKPHLFPFDHIQEPCPDCTDEHLAKGGLTFELPLAQIRPCRREGQRRRRSIGQGYLMVDARKGEDRRK